MSRIFLIIAITLVILPGVPATTSAQAAPSPSPTAAPSGRQIIARMYRQYAGHWYHTFTFNQTTQQYRNDSLVKTQTWYEFMRLPDRFRMDFGDADSGNAAIFRGDSCYRFKNGRLASTTINNNEGLIFLLGGMFFYTQDQVYAMLDTLHYDLTACRQDRWQDRATFVIGKDGANQLWIDAEHLYLVRMLKVDGQQTLDARFDDYKPFGGGWSETKCSFYLNGKLIQMETYHDCKAEVSLGDALFDPSKLIHSH